MPQKPAYVILNVNVTDPEQYEAYKVYSSKAIQEYEAEILVRGGEMEVLEGEAYPRLVLLKFPHMDQARAFYNSETYLQGRAARQNAAVANVILVEGV